MARHLSCRPHRQQRRHGAGGTRGPVWRRGLREGRTVQVPIYDLKSSTRVGFREVNVPKSRMVSIEGIYALSSQDG
ncbi:unnamed protein product [Closterium sp. NIES-65]|nr:unnamed protein product [Closterium sp. NIES-65]